MILAKARAAFACRSHTFWHDLVVFTVPRHFRRSFAATSIYQKTKVPAKAGKAFEEVLESVNETLTEPEDHGEIFQRWTGNVASTQHLLIIQPEYKWGRDRFLTKLSQHRLEEAQGLVQSIPGWVCQSSTIESIHDHHGGSFFGSGKVKELRDRINGMKRDQGITAVLVNTGNLNKRQTRELEREWDCRVFDRFRVVLEIFKERARTKTAKLQVQLAELQYLRSHMVSDVNSKDHPRGRATAISGARESPVEKDKRLVASKTEKIKKELLKIRAQRHHVREERKHKQVPQVALLGYTNAGKTTLAKVLSKDSKLEPEDKLFATLDSTAHGSKLPSGCNVIYIDTVGFVSDLPHGLIGSFSATLDDVLNANLLVHVRDMSHPECELQKKTVLDVLERLGVDHKLQDSMIEVQNKIDLSDVVSPALLEPHAFQVSALHNTGIETLMKGIESSIFHLTGRRLATIVVDPGSEQLGWLHKETTVVSCDSSSDGILHVTAIMDTVTANKYKAKFGSKILL